MRRARLRGDSNYKLKSVVFSHGWSDLPPFRVSSVDGSVRVALRGESRPAVVHLYPCDQGIELHTEVGVLTDRGKADLRHMFRLDGNFDPFYRHARKVDRTWIEEACMGRLLRSQTVFEDLVKLILTTNCSWSLTRLMCDRLAQQLGEEVASEFHLFPSAEALAGKSEGFYREKIRAGYRSPHLRTLGRLVVSGKLDPERWLDPDLPSAEIRREILAVPGAGPYVADNLMRLLGRYETLGLDSWARGKLKAIWAMKKIPSDRTVERRYAEHGPYKGLILWCDLTRDWFTSNRFEDWIRTQQPANRNSPKSEIPR